MQQYRQLWELIMSFLSQRKWLETSADHLEHLGCQLEEGSLQIGDDQLLRFFEWLLWDYRLLPGAGGRERVFDILLRELPQSVSPEEKRLLAKWSEATVTMAQVKFSDRNERLLILDLFSGQQLAAASYATGLQPGSIYLGRWLPVDGNRLVPAPMTVKVPDELYSFLHRKIEGHFAAFAGSLEEYCRQWGSAFFSWLGELQTQSAYRSTLFFEVLDYRQLVRALMASRDFALANKTVVDLYGPLAFVLSIPEGEARLIMDRDELVVFAESLAVLRRAKTIIGLVGSYSVEFVDECISDGDLAEANLAVSQLVNSLPWPRSQDRSVARLLESSLSVTRAEQKSNAIRLWYDFCRSVKPRFRKPAGWAAAVELALREIELLDVDAQELEDKYQVSESTLKQNYDRLKKALDLVIGDSRYSSLFE